MKQKIYVIFQYKRYSAVILMIGFIFLEACTSNESRLKTSLEKAPVFDTSTPLGKEVKKLFDLYNVRFDYYWNRYAFAQDVIADPSDIKDVLPYIEIFNVLYFEAINKVTGSQQFSKKESPLTIFLLGSGINYGGTQDFGESTAGQAGNIQPNRLTLGGLNEMGKLLRVKGNQGDSNFLKYIYDDHISSNPSEAGEVGFIYHEWTHYIDSKHDIPKKFEKPAFDNYLRGTNAYKRITYSDARKKGFMLPYGMQNEHEDMATYVQIMVWKPRNYIEQNYLLSDATKQKYKMVYDYYKNLGLDLFKLRDYLHSDEVKQKLLSIKHRYDGTIL